RMGHRRLPLLLSLLPLLLNAQLLQQMGGAQVKITEQPFLVSNAQHLNQIVWTMIGNTIKESIYCVSEAPVSQLRFVCLDCEQKNITDMVPALNSAQDLTRSAGFPTVVLKLSTVNSNWTGATVVCQAALNGGTVDSAPATVDVRFLRQPHVVDSSGQGPVLIPNQGYRFYVECQRMSDGFCNQSGRRKTLRCNVQSHPAATTFRWLKNGVVTSGSGAEITIGVEMIGQSLQCTANNGLYSDIEMPTSQAVQIDPYSAAKIVTDNFQAVQLLAPFQAGNRIEMHNDVNLQCTVEGNPRPVVYWKLRRNNGQIVDAPCPQGYEGVYAEIPDVSLGGLQRSVIKMKSTCTMRVSNYSFSGQYWCSACSVVSQGQPECSPSLDTPGSSVLNMQVQGAPMQSEPITIEQMPNNNNAIISVHYCAEPVPRPPREIVFSIDQNDIQVGQKWDNFQFQNNVQNNTVSNCFIARLQVTQITEQDQYRQIYFKVQNQFGSKQIPVPLDSLLGGGSALSARFSPWWIVLIVLAALGLVCLVALAFCSTRKLCCFDRVKKDHEDYGDVKSGLSNVNVRSTLYGDDLPPRPYISHQVVPSSGEKAPSQRSPSVQEGLNYAEMRLADRQVKVPVATSMRIDAPPYASITSGPSTVVSTRTAHTTHQLTPPSVVNSLV
ncbi:hypothetical protein PFISCL1PPCAC_26526, partial [Pristionchus fissidentatus]